MKSAPLSSGTTSRESIEWDPSTQTTIALGATDPRRKFAIGSSHDVLRDTMHFEFLGIRGKILKGP